MRRPNTPLEWAIVILGGACVAGIVWIILLGLVSPYSPNPMTGQVYLLPSGKLHQYITRANALVSYATFADALLVIILAAILKMRRRRR